MPVSLLPRTTLDCTRKRGDISDVVHASLDAADLAAAVAPATAHHQISDITLTLPGVWTSTVVVDGTACVGGNAISFASTFDEVW